MRAVFAGRAGRQVGREERRHLEIVQGRLLHDLEEWPAKLLRRAQHHGQQMVDHERHDCGRDMDEVTKDRRRRTEENRVLMPVSSVVRRLSSVR